MIPAGVGSLCYQVINKVSIDNIDMVLWEYDQTIVNFVINIHSDVLALGGARILAHAILGKDWND